MSRYKFNNLYEYPALYISSGRVEFDINQISHLYAYEKEAGPILNTTDIDELKIDFNAGLRVQVPKGNFHVKISDYATETVFFDDDVSEKTLISAEKYYIRWQIDIQLDGEDVFSHVLDLEGQEVYFFMAGAALGDMIAVLEYLPEFQRQYKCRVLATVPDTFKEICANYYSDIMLVDKRPEDLYASYCLAMFQIAPYITPQDTRIWTTSMTARAILGLNHDAPHILYTPNAKRGIKEKYVCIAVQASGIMKRWLYLDGWNKVVTYLRLLGYRVLCIDAEAGYCEGEYSISIPLGAENFTGYLPLMERVNLLAYADFFIGLGSGLSWLAWACDIPVILISGFSLPMGEFETPYRVTNQLVCHGCYNDISVNWKDGCPYHRGTEREFECSKKISPKQVITMIDKLILDMNL